MRSLGDVGRWLFRKTVAFGLIFVALVAISVLWGLVPSALDSMESASEAARQLPKAVRELETIDGRLQTLERALDEATESAPNPLLHPLDWWKHRKETQLKRATLRELRKAQALAEGRVHALTQVAGQLPGRVLSSFQKYARQALAIIFVVFFGPILWRVVAYFALAPMASSRRPIQLADPTTGGEAAISPPTRELTVDIRPEEDWYFRHRAITARRGVSTRWWPMLPGRAVLISSAARLLNITVVRRDSAASEGSVCLGGHDPHTEFGLVELDGHPGFTILPRHLAGMSSGIRLETRWNLSWHGLLTGQVRYVIFSGTGRLVVEAEGGVRGQRGDVHLRTKAESDAIVGFDCRISYSTTRTEQAPAYVLGRSDLMDDQFQGLFLLLRVPRVGRGKSNWAKGGLDTMLSAFGKLLGL